MFIAFLSAIKIAIAVISPMSNTLYYQVLKARVLKTLTTPWSSFL